MAFFVLLPVRDEADVIDQCLEQLQSWADEIYVFDTGSVDDTWERVQEAAAHDQRIKPLRKDPVFFCEHRVRGWMFDQARGRMTDGDWFVRADADEFHHISPREFVATRMKPHETVAYHQYYNFCLLESEAKAWDDGRETKADRDRPIADRRHWYQVSLYSEPRLCRYRRTMQWPQTVSFPFNAGFVARRRLPIRHYPHRDPAQLERRCRLRTVMMADEENRKNWVEVEHHWNEREWRKFVMPDNDPSLSYWAPGQELAEVNLTNHLATPHIRLVQRMAHSFVLPALDRRRPTWPLDGYPQRIPADVVAALAKSLNDDSANQLRHP